jgi:hypothetical protein
MSNYKVGYGKPPRSCQFRKGRSGNPRGRPKGRANLATDLATELTQKITIREDGRSCTISKQRALIKALVAKALQGDVRAMSALLGLYARLIAELPGDEAQPIDADELQILRRFAPRLLRSMRPR